MAWIVATVVRPPMVGFPIDRRIEPAIEGKLDDFPQKHLIGGIDAGEEGEQVANGRPGTIPPQGMSEAAAQREGQADLIHIVSQLDAELTLGRPPSRQK